MMSTRHAEAGPFACTSCGRRHRWKRELAGRAVKCACGQVMTYPMNDPGPDTGEEYVAIDDRGEDLYAVAPDVSQSSSSGVTSPGRMPASITGTSQAHAAPRGLTYRRPTEDTGGVDA